MSKIVPPFVRSPFNYDAMAVSNETGLSCPEDTLTQQNFAEECDINRIVETLLEPAISLSPFFRLSLAIFPVFAIFIQLLIRYSLLKRRLWLCLLRSVPGSAMILKI